MAAVDINATDSSPFVPGTTWVFDIPSDKDSQKPAESMDDFLDTFDSENATLKVSICRSSMSDVSQDASKNIPKSADTAPIMLRRQITDPIPITPTNSPSPRKDVADDR